MYLLSGRLYPPIIDRLCPLTHRTREPPKPLRQRRHRIFLEIIHPRQRSSAPLSCRRHSRLAAKPAIFPPLARRQSLRPTRILIPLPREEVLILRLLRPWSRAARERRRGSHRGRRRRFPAAGFRLLPLLLDRHACELPPVDPAAQPLFVLLASVAAVSIPHHPHRLPVPALPWLPPLLPAFALPEFLPVGVPAELHSTDFGGLERVHLYGAYEGDVHAQTAVQAGACEADEGAEFGGGPLRGRGGAVDAGGVSGTFLESCELQFCQLEGIELVGGKGGDLGLSFGVDFPHLVRLYGQLDSRMFVMQVS